MKIDPVEKVFKEKVIKEFLQKYNLKNPMAVPRPVKVTINIGIGDEAKDEKAIEEILKIVESITGQKPVLTKARKSVAEFNVRKGDPIGIKVTLRGKRMWDFLNRLINLALPQVKDFRGVNPGSFDKNGNYTLGLVEYLVFPEVDPSKVDRVKGMSIAITFSGGDPEKNRFILERLGFVFKKEEKKE